MSERTATERVQEYVDRVLSGDIVAGPHVRNACRRHNDDMRLSRERGIYWSESAAMHVMRFFERRLKLSEGQFENQPFLLAPVQCFILGSLFGWWRAPKDAQGNWVFEASERKRLGLRAKRRFRRAYIEMGKGQGKSPLVGGIGLYGMTEDGEAGAQIYAAAAKKEQAGILFQDACKMVRRSPALNKAMKFSGGIGREYNIAHHKSGSFFRPISKDAGKSGSGPRPHFALCDEVHEHPDRSIMEMLERGFKFRENPLLMMITNSGSDRGSICWEEHVHACKTAAGIDPEEDTVDDNWHYVGKVYDDTTFSYVCAMDKGDEPLTDPSVWEKANPMLGIILDHEYIEGVAQQALQQPGKRNGILRLHFCVWTDSDTAWFTKEQIDGVFHNFDPYVEHAGRDVSLGVDLSGSRDLTAAAHVVRTGEKEFLRKNPDGSEEMKLLPTYDAWVEAWTPGATLKVRAQKDKAPYEKWVEDGYLHATAGERVRYDEVAAHIQRVDDAMNILGIAYDRYAYSKLQDECDAIGLELDHIAHPQGGKNRARPHEKWVEAAKSSGRDALGLWMPGSVVALEEAIAEGRIRLRISPVLMTAIMGSTFDEDAQGNRWFVKTKASVRIDAVVALAMAIGLAEHAPPPPKKQEFKLFFM